MLIKLFRWNVVGFVTITQWVLVRPEVLDDFVGRSSLKFYHYYLYLDNLIHLFDIFHFN